MTTMISDLPRDLIEEILTGVPLTSMRRVRLTCRKWDTLSKSRSFTATREGESVMISMFDDNLHLMSVFVDVHPSTELKGKLTCLNEQVKISQVFHCEGLLLCILTDDDSNRVVVWNPYLGQTRWIESRHSHAQRQGFHEFSYALGYEDKESCRNLKFLRFVDYYDARGNQSVLYEIYDFESDLWRILDVTPHWHIESFDLGVSLKGNTYWPAMGNSKVNHMICFDFTRESFGPLLPLPLSVRDHEYEFVDLSCVREEKLAALFQQSEANPYELEIWITTKIEVQVVSWSKFLRMDPTATVPCTMAPLILGGFFIDEEKKVAMGFEEDHPMQFIIIREAGFYRESDLLREPGYQYCSPGVCSYVPSLVQITRQTVCHKRKKQSSLEKRRFINKCRDSASEKPECRRRQN